MHADVIQVQTVGLSGLVAQGSANQAPAMGAPPSAQQPGGIPAQHDPTIPGFQTAIMVLERLSGDLRFVDEQDYLQVEQLRMKLQQLKVKREQNLMKQQQALQSAMATMQGAAGAAPVGGM